jgi:hypothetical protein
MEVVGVRIYPFFKPVYDPDQAPQTRYDDWSTPKRRRHLAAAAEKYAEQLRNLESTARTAHTHGEEVA